MYKSRLTGIIRRSKRQYYTIQDVMEYMKCDRSEALQEIERVQAVPDLRDKVKFVEVREV